MAPQLSLECNSPSSFLALLDRALSLTRMTPSSMVPHATRTKGAENDHCEFMGKEEPYAARGRVACMQAYTLLERLQCWSDHHHPEVSGSIVTLL